MAEALINVLLEQLVTVAFDHTKEAVKLILNAETEVKKFRSNLKAIQAVLEDAEKQQVENASVRNWLDELNDVSYKMVDVLDEWNTEILKQEAMRVPSEKKETFKKFLNRNECFTAEVKEADKEILRISEEVRHLTLMFVPYESSFLDLISPANCKKLRTLATFDSKISSVDLIAISKMKCLRTLNLSNNAIEEFPEEMGALIHLRYLDLSRNWRLEKLPDSVGNLYNLQTLRLDGCDELSALPESMGNLTKLRHLHNKYCRNLAYLPRGIARLTSLQTLDFCPVMDGECLKLEDLGSLDQLEGSLKIVIKTFKGKLNDATSEAHKARLWSKKLYFLTIEIALLTEEQTQRTADILLEALRPHQDLLHLNIWGDTLWPCSAVPSWMIPLQNLRSLELWRFRGFECLPPLGTLPFLEEFSVSGMDKVKRVGHEFLGMPNSQTTSSSSSSVFFPKLKKLYLTELCEWEHWEEVGGDGVTIMPCLDHLQIYHCPKLVNLPLFLQNTALSKVIISGCRQSIIIPIMPANCDVEIEDEIEDSEDERVETETHIVSQIDEEITVIT
ncbi:putative disease resistance protein RGA3 isoform X2 [Argentina anserina]|uniref:putative disease resistance protein RGA3 isoform X2 n=1 Tax=Argentina anserina TaxID=57926 RepID=UPI0021767E39|nr:putative disease resistance protein RGA3 isoform X2 [Potentilla anserina]